MDNDMLSTATFMRTWRASVPEKEKHRMASFWQGGGRVDDQLEDEWRCLRSNWDYIVCAREQTVEKKEMAVVCLEYWCDCSYSSLITGLRRILARSYIWVNHASCV